MGARPELSRASNEVWRIAMLSQRYGERDSNPNIPHMTKIAINSHAQSIQTIMRNQPIQAMMRNQYKQ